MEGSQGDMESMAELKALALRFLKSTGVSQWQRREQTTQPPSEMDLLVRKLPPRFPLDVPLFEDGQLLGSVVMDEVLRVLIKTDRDPARVIDWYRDRFTQAGWAEPEPITLPRHGTFAVAVRPWGDGIDRVLFCKTWTGPSATVVARRDEAQLTTVEVEVNLSTDPGTSPCNDARRMKRQWEQLEQPRLSRGHDVIPPLNAPPRSVQGAEGGSGGTGRWRSHAILYTNLDMASLAAHYEAELTAGGWERVSGGVVEGAAFSRWRFTPPFGQSGRGLLLILQNDEQPDHYDLTIKASWSPPDQKGLA